MKGCHIVQSSDTAQGAWFSANVWKISQILPFLESAASLLNKISMEIE